MKQPRLPKKDSPRIAIESPKAKKQLIEIADRKGETLKETLERLINAEYRKEG